MASFMTQKVSHMSPATEPERRRTCPRHVSKSFFFRVPRGTTGPQRQTTSTSGPQPRNSSLSKASRQGQHSWGLSPVQLLPKATFRVSFPICDFRITCWLQNRIPHKICLHHTLVQCVQCIITYKLHSPTLKKKGGFENACNKNTYAIRQLRIMILKKEKENNVWKTTCQGNHIKKIVTHWLNITFEYWARQLLMRERKCINYNFVNVKDEPPRILPRITQQCKIFKCLFKKASCFFKRWFIGIVTTRTIALRMSVLRSLPPTRDLPPPSLKFLITGTLSYMSKWKWCF